MRYNDTHRFPPFTHVLAFKAVDDEKSSGQDFYESSSSLFNNEALWDGQDWFEFYYR